MHSVLPHEHHAQLSDAEHVEAHSSADSLLGHIQLIFHVDMGDGHLDHFESCQGLDCDLKSLGVVSPLYARFTEALLGGVKEHKNTAEEHHHKRGVFPDSHLFYDLSRRGPPTLS